jgi:hypothetical protein
MAKDSIKHLMNEDINIGNKYMERYLTIVIREIRGYNDITQLEHLIG